MNILYIKAIHIVFMVSWFAGLFYIVRLFIYHTEGLHDEEPKRTILHEQFMLMEKRLLNIITTPAMIITVATGLWMLYLMPGYLSNGWMHVKLTFVAGLIGYHVICFRLSRQLGRGRTPMTSTQLRMFNEVATIGLVAVVFLVIVRNMISMLWGVAGLIGLGVLMMIAIKLYKKSREKNNK